jgi:molybdenum cofactor synthesis domain-containing protein
VTETKTSLRCLVATVAPGRGSVQDDITTVLLEELRAAKLDIVRSVTVNREKQFIEQLVRNVATGNEADVILIVGGSGIGPRDFACQAVDALADRAIEGFGEEYRRIMREDDGALIAAVLARATAAVCDGCVVVALPRQASAVMRRALQKLVVPMLPHAVRIAGGGGHV